MRTCVFLCERAVCVSFVNARAHVCMYLCVCVWGGGVQWHLRLRRRRRTGVTKLFQLKYIDYTFTIECLLLHIHYSTLIRGCGGARCWRSPGVPCARCASSRPTGAASAPPPTHTYTHLHRCIYTCVCSYISQYNVEHQCIYFPVPCSTLHTHTHTHTLTHTCIHQYLALL